VIRVQSRRVVLYKVTSPSSLFV